MTSIAVAGSHGKTTTHQYDRKNIKCCKFESYICVGGKVLSTDENSDLGDGNYLVAEADESDGTFTHLHQM